MTLDEAIKHAKEKAIENDKLCKRYDDASGYTRSHNEKIRTTDAIKCEMCANEHRQLAEWLKELKQLREQSRWTPVSERSPEDSGEYLVSVIDEEDEDYKQVGVAWFAHPKDYDIQDGEWRDLMIDEKVVAWMPKPKPYKTESEER